MKKVLTGIMLLLAGNMFVLVHGDVLQNQEYIQGPVSEKWSMYIDYSLESFQDLNLMRYTVRNASDPLPFRASNSTDIKWRSNSFSLGMSYNISSDEVRGDTDFYFGLKQVSSQIGLFPTGMIGVRGWGIETGIEGDLFRFGGYLENSIEYGICLNGLLSKGSRSGAVDQEYDLAAAGLDLRLVYSVSGKLADVTSARAYAVGVVTYMRGRLTLENSGSVTGTGEYDLENRLENMLYGIAGVKLFWEKDRTATDIYVAGSLDRSYMIGIRIVQNF